ncbi:HAD hydrolase-like protein [Candidatus Pacearchaeota archaeon]|nr:HAD hydrolase-like protein [Candidatus Pacearchaeota archaeon]
MNFAVDIDDTLLDFVGTYIVFHNETFKTNLKKEDFKTYSFNHARGGTMKQAVSSVRQFYNTDFFKEMKPFPGAIEIIQELKENNDLFIVTSRPYNMKNGTFDQLSKYFLNMFSEVFFSSNHYTRAKNSGKTKAEICNDLEASLLIDDSLVYSKECVKNGVGAILLDAPWNQNGSVEGITRAKDWKEIGGLLL